MRTSVAVEPLCAGMCKHLHTFGRSRMTLRTSSGKSFGCGEVNRMRISGSTCATRSSSSANCTFPSLLRPASYRDSNPAAYPLNFAGSSPANPAAFFIFNSSLALLMFKIASIELFPTMFPSFKELKKSSDLFVST